MNVSSFFKNKQGNVAVFQMPNAILTAWIVSKFLSFFIEGKLQSQLDTLSFAFLFTWSYLELTSGISPFRRTLGGVVLFSIVLSLVLGT